MLSVEVGSATASWRSAVATASAEASATTSVDEVDVSFFLVAEGSCEG